MRLLVILFLALILSCTPPARALIVPECTARSIDFSVDARFSEYDRYAFEDAALWWLQYGVVVKFHYDRDPEAKYYLWYAEFNDPSVLAYEKKHNKRVLGLAYDSPVPTVLIVKDRVYGHEATMGVLSHEIGHLLGMPDDYEDDNSLMYYIYNGMPEHLSTNDWRAFKRCQL